MTNDPVRLLAGGCVALRSEADVESVLWAGDQAPLAARHAAHGRDDPLAKLEGPTCVDHRHLQAKAILVALVTKFKGAADARATYGLPAKVVAVEFGRPERGGGELLWGDARHDVRFCQKRSVDRQITVVECEHSLFRLDVDRKIWRGQKIVERIVAAAEVSAATICEVHMRVTKNLGVCSARVLSQRGDGQGQHVLDVEANNLGDLGARLEEGECWKALFLWPRW